MKIVAAGASGLIGGPLLARLARTHEVVSVSRRYSQDAPRMFRQVLWDAASSGEWEKEIDGADVVINLAGEPIAGRRWTARQKILLRKSRLDSTRAVVAAIQRVKKRPSVYLNASAIGFYGDRGDQALDESSPRGSGFLSEMCMEWEDEAKKAEVLGVRTVFLRTGIVLSPKGGALAKMLPPFRWGIGGALGSGRQFMSWIHLEDELSAILEVLTNPSIRGAVNLTAPEPVDMKTFAKTLGKTTHRPAMFPVPTFALRLLLGEMADMLLGGQRVIPKKLGDAGFRFKYPSLGPALQSLL